MRRVKRSLLWLICICCAGVLFGGALFADSARPAAQAETMDKLTEISVQEKAVVRELFALSSNLQLLNTQIAQSEADIATLNGEIADKQKAIDNAAQSFDSIRDSLGQVLKAQQRAGAASSLEVVLNAESLRDLLQRINLLRDLSRKTSELMASVETAKQKLQAEKQALDTLLGSLQAENQKLRESYQNQQTAKIRLESYLNSLSAERAHYEDYLKAMERQWKSLKPLFAEAVKSLNALIQAGGLPPETATVTYSLFSSKVVIHQDKFNAELAKRKDLNSMRFILKKDAVNLEFPAYKILLRGNFKLAGPQKLQYTVTGGDFYGLPMNDSALKDLFSDGALVFNLKAMLGRSTLKRIEPQNGDLILFIENSL